MMKKSQIIKKIISEKFASKAQQRFFYAMADKNTKKGKKFKKWAKEFSDDTDFDEIPEKVKETAPPKMKKGDLIEYINSKNVVKEQDEGQYDFPRLNEVEPQERRDIMKYLEMIRQSGIINMFGAAPILNWTKDDLYRFLYGERNDPESIERAIEEERDESISESLLEDKLEKINYLLDNKQKIRDILVRAALRRIENTTGNHEMSNVQRVFEKMAKESWAFWVGIQNIR